MKNFTKKVSILVIPAFLPLLLFLILFWSTASPTESIDESSQNLRFTVIKGRVLDAVAASEGSEIPVVGAEIHVFGAKGSTITDSNGYFELRRVPLERGMVINIDSSGADPAPDGSIYAGFRMFFSLQKSRVNNFERPFYLTRLDPESITTINPLETTVVESPSMGVTLTIKPGTAYTDDGQLYDGIIGLGLVPADFPPYIPPDDPGMFLMVTIQPPGINFSEPAEMSFPNLDGFPPGSELSIVQPSLATGNFEEVGIGIVSEDGAYIETLSGGIRRSGSCNGTRPPNPVGGPPVQDPPPCPDCCPLPIGSCTSLASGNLSEEHNLVSYKSLNEDRSLKFVYNSTQADPRPIIKEISDLSNQTNDTPIKGCSMSLKVAGVNRGSIYSDVQGILSTPDKKIVQAIQFDAGNLTTGIYPLDATITTHFFVTNTKQIINTGDLIINNLKNSEFGSGWSIEGVSRLFSDADGDVVIIEGNGDWKYFKRRATTLNPPIAPGVTGTALRFDGINDEVKYSSAAQNLLKVLPLTIEAWVRPLQRYDDLAPHSHVVGGVAVSSGLGQVLERGVGIGVNYYNRQSNIVITRKNSNADSGPTNYLAREFITSPQFEPGFWNHVAVVYTSGNHKVYLNGELINDSSYPQGNFNNIGILRMGRISHCCIVDPSSPQFYKGDIDEVRIWNVARTQEDIQSGMSTQLSGSESGLIYYSKIDEGQGTTIADVIGGLTGTLGCCNRDIERPVWITYDPYDRDTQGDYVVPVTEHSLLFKNPDGSYTRKLKDGTEIHFNALGLQTSVVDKNGNATNYEYDGQGKLISIIDPVGLVTTLAYSGDKIASVTDPAGRTTTFEMDGSGNLTKITDPDGTFRQFAYDSNHRLTSQTSKRGFLTTYQYNFAGRSVGATRPDGSTVSLSPQWMAGLIDPSTGLGTQNNPAPYVPPSEIKATSTDGNGKTTTTIFNNFGYILDTTDPLGRRTIFTRGGANNVIKIIDPKGNITDMNYDPKHNLNWSINQAIGATTTFTYTDDGFNQIKTIKDPRNNTTTFSYNSSGDLASIVDALGHQTTIAYNPLGLQTSITDALSNTVSFDYDPATMNLVGTTDQLLQDTIFTLDAAGNIASMTDAEGRTTTYSYDAMNRLTQVVDPDLAVTTYDYDDAGNLAGVTDARLKTTTFSYDQRDRLNGRTDPLGHSESFTYDGNGNTVSTTNRNGQTITYEYNDANELIKKTLPGSIITSYTYDNNGNMLTAFDPDSRLTMTYDGADRMLTVSTSGSSNQPDIFITNSYDLNGNRTQMKLFTDFVYFTGDYDAVNRLISFTDPRPTTSTIMYDAIGRRTRKVAPDGLTTDYTYDDKSQLTSLINTYNGNVISSFTYGYDNVGNRTDMNTIRSGVAATSPLNYIYDDLYRLVEATNPINSIPETFVYDSVGNRLRKTGQITDSIFDNANAMIDDAEYTYTYDNNGNMIEKVNKSTLDVTQYTYDAENRLIQTTKPGTIASYRYDAFGRRVEKNVNGTATRYIYDGVHVLEEYNSNNTSKARYIRWPGLDETLFVLISGVRNYYFTDGLGSTTELVSPEGNILNSYVYDSFGNVLSQTGAVVNPLTYTGREYDEESGLYYYRARYYDPTIGRFLQEDPVPINIIFPNSVNTAFLTFDNPIITKFLGNETVGFIGGDVNLYTYVLNNPQKFTDPSGKFVQVLPLLCAGGGCQAAITAGVVILGAATGKIVSDIINCLRDMSDEFDKERCRKVKQKCIEQCSDETLPTKYGDGAEFFKCYNDCMKANGCL